MAGVIRESWNVYRERIGLAIIFSIPFVIAFAIPLLAPLPTYISAGAIFLRSASIFANGNIDLVSLAVITASTIFSLLFLSFAFVLISLLVKSKRTHSSVGKRVFEDLEKYIWKVFAVLLVYTLILMVASMVGYALGISTLLTAVVGFVLFLVIFYAPSAIVVDNKKASRAVVDSLRLVLHEPQYFIIWLVLATVIVSLVDVACIGLFGTLWSRYIALIINSLLVVPYFVIFQAQAYMDRFRLLRH